MERQGGLTVGPQDSASHFMSCSFLSMDSKSIEKTATPSLSSRRLSSCSGHRHERQKKWKINKCKKKRNNQQTGKESASGARGAYGGGGRKKKKKLGKKKHQTCGRDENRDAGEGAGGGAYLVAACLSHLTIDHASLSRRSTGVEGQIFCTLWCLVKYPEKYSFFARCSCDLLPGIHITGGGRSY